MAVYGIWWFAGFYGPFLTVKHEYAIDDNYGSQPSRHEQAGNLLRRVLLVFMELLGCRLFGLPIASRLESIRIERNVLVWFDFMCVILGTQSNFYIQTHRLIEQQIET